MTTDDRSDDALLAELANALAPELTPPPHVVESAKQAFTWRTIDAELALLTHDSLLDAEPALARSASGPRILTFEISSLVIEVEVDPDPSGRRLLGQVVPAAETDIELRSGEVGGAVEVLSSTRSDALGRFALPLPARPALVALRCSLPDGTAVETARTRI